MVSLAIIMLIPTQTAQAAGKATITATVNGKKSPSSTQVSIIYFKYGNVIAYDYKVFVNNSYYYTWE